MEPMLVLAVLWNEETPRMSSEGTMSILATHGHLIVNQDCLAGHPHGLHLLSI